jgi:hypothetical protein
VGKRLAEIRKEVDDSGMSFVSYMKRNLEDDVYEFLLKLARNTPVYVFSGIIRNFFLNNNEVRDLDLVIEDNVNIVELFHDFEIKRNSFGGYKIVVGNTNVDLWHLENTWAINYQLMLPYELYRYIPSTAFFNFSAVIFNFNERKFLCNNPFLSFLNTKKINYVYKPNANYALCVVNSLYYVDKYNLGIEDKLVRYLKELRKKNLDYSEIQIKHFGKIIYSDELIKARIDKLKLSR